MRARVSMRHTGAGSSMSPSSNHGVPPALYVFWGLGGGGGVPAPHFIFQWLQTCQTESPSWDICLIHLRQLKSLPVPVPLAEPLCLIFIHQVYQQCRGFNRDVWTIKGLTVLAHVYVGARAGVINHAWKSVNKVKWPDVLFSQFCNSLWTTKKKKKFHPDNMFLF